MMALAYAVACLVMLWVAAGSGAAVPAVGRSSSAQQRLVIVNDDFGAYQLAADSWFKYPDTLRALAQNPVNFRAPHALRGGLPGLYSEFDGGFELIYALRDPGVKIIGITTQYGISSAPNAFTTAQQIVRAVRSQDRRVPRNIPILRGARDANDLGHQTAASRFIERTVMANCGRVELIDTAPLTNTATAFMHQPRLARCLKRLWFVTGEFNGALKGVKPSDFTVHHVPDFNINADAAGSRYVLSHAGSVAILPNELEDDTWMTKSDFLRIAAARSVLAKFVTQQNLPFYNHYFVNNPNPLTGPPPNEPGIMFHGAIGTAFAIDPGFSKGVKAFRSAVVLRWAGRFQQWIFALSSNRRLPKDTIYAQLSPRQTRRMHDAVLSRLR